MTATILSRSADMSRYAPTGNRGVRGGSINEEIVVMSRSRFAVRFKAAAGVAPQTYVSKLAHAHSGAEAARNLRAPLSGLYVRKRIQQRLHTNDRSGAFALSVKKQGNQPIDAHGGGRLGPIYLKTGTLIWIHEDGRSCVGVNGRTAS